MVLLKVDRKEWGKGLLVGWLVGGPRGAADWTGAIFCAAATKLVINKRPIYQASEEI